MYSVPIHYTTFWRRDKPLKAAFKNFDCLNFLMTFILILQNKNADIRLSSFASIILLRRSFKLSIQIGTNSAICSEIPFASPEISFIFGCGNKFRCLDKIFIKFYQMKYYSKCNYYFCNKNYSCK